MFKTNFLLISLTLISFSFQYATATGEPRTMEKEIGESIDAIFAAMNETEKEQAKCVFSLLPSAFRTTVECKRMMSNMEAEKDPYVATDSSYRNKVKKVCNVATASWGAIGSIIELISVGEAEEAFAQLENLGASSEILASSNNAEPMARGKAIFRSLKKHGLSDKEYEEIITNLEIIINLE